MKDTKFLLLIAFFSTFVGTCMYTIDLFKVIGYITLWDDKLVSLAMSCSSVAGLISKLSAPFVYSYRNIPWWIIKRWESLYSSTETYEK